LLLLKEKQEEAEKTAGARRIARLGIAKRALNGPRNLTSTSPQPLRRLKTTLKTTTKNREAKKDKQRCNILTPNTDEGYLGAF
jgi:hypothetical protein